MTRRRTPWARLGGLLLALGAGGCATATGAAELVGFRWTDRSASRSAPRGPQEHRVMVTLEGTDPVRFSCRTASRSELRRITDEAWQYGPLWRVLMVGAGLAEAGVATWALVAGVGGDPTSTASRGLAVGFGADAALTLLLAAALPTRHQVVDLDVRGTWTEREGCPSALGVARPERRVGVALEGRIDAADERWLVARWVAEPEGAALAVGSRSEALAPPVARRCAWARARGLPGARALCPDPSVTYDSGWDVRVTFEALTDEDLAGP